MLLIQHWQAPPVPLTLVAITLVIHTVGLRRMRIAGRAPSERGRQRAHQAWLFRGGMAAILIALASPIDYWADIDFWVHMVQHLVLLYVCGPLIVLGAPWLPLARGVPAGLRRSVLRYLYLQPGGKRIRSLGQLISYPPAAGTAFVVTFYAWHIPAAYDLTLRNQTVHDIEHACFLAVGVWLWGVLVGSYPYEPRWSELRRFGLVSVVMFSGWFLAIGMAFSRHLWYPAYAHVLAPHMQPLADQQLGAAFMWVIPMFPFGILAGRLVHKFIEKDGDDESRLQALVAETRLQMYGGSGQTA